MATKKEMMLVALGTHVIEEHDGELRIPVRGKGLMDIDAELNGGDIVIKAKISSDDLVLPNGHSGLELN